MSEDQPLNLEEVCDDEIGLCLDWFFLDLTVHLVQCLLLLRDVALADPYTTVSYLEHLRIVIPITDSHDFILKIAFCHLNDLCFLGRAHPDEDG